MRITRRQKATTKITLPGGASPDFMRTVEEANRFASQGFFRPEDLARLTLLAEIARQLDLLNQTAQI